MGGKSYYCDYCQCFMKNNINVRKTHNDALLHKMIKIRFMRKFEDPRKVYEGEVRKTQCSHFFKGRCRYDLYCQASHYTQKQLDQLRQIGEAIIVADECRNSLYSLGENLIKEKQPAAATKQFNSSEEKKPQSRKRKRTKAKDLPPSLRPIQLNKLANLIDKNNTWG